MSDIRYKMRARKPKGFQDLPSLCRMEISIGQAYHEGEKLKLAMNWARNNYERTVILLGDTQQRFNIAFHDNLEINQALEVAYQRGQEWVNRNKSVIGDTEIVSWNYFLNHHKFISAKKAVFNLLETNSVFRTNLDEAVSDFYKRSSVPEHDRKRFMDASRQYLIEETAGLAIAYKEYPGFSAYPGSFFDMWGYFIGKDAPKELEGLTNAHCVRLCFNRRKAA